MNKVIIIDDNKFFLDTTTKLLKIKNYEVIATQNPHNIFENLDFSSCFAVLLDYDFELENINGFDILKKIKHHYPKLPIIIISGEGNINVAVDMIKEGAYDYIEKPFDPEKLLVLLKNAKERFQLINQTNFFESIIKEKYRFIGNSKKIKNIFSTIIKIKNSNSKVLITGETGTGKELIAWAIHSESSRSSGPYIKINCASIPASLFESEFFGHKKGSFTNAYSDKDGSFLLADGGTLFLDEIGELPLDIQAKLLRVLNDNTIQPIGGTKPIEVDVRVIAATNKDLEKMIKEGNFREDLFHRLDGVRIFIPPLRERKEDIMILAYYFLKISNEENNKKIIGFSPKVQEYFLNQHWKGNVREFKNFINKLVNICDEEEISIENVFEIVNYKYDNIFDLSEFVGVISLEEANNEFEKKYIKFILNQFPNKTEAAKALGIDRSGLYKKIKKHKLEDN